jgi:hypothetical protein
MEAKAKYSFHFFADFARSLHSLCAGRQAGLEMFKYRNPAYACFDYAQLTCFGRARAKIAKNFTENAKYNLGDN